MEIKRSLYSDAGRKISNVIGGNNAYNLVGDVAQEIKFDSAKISDADFTTSPGLGVICVREHKQQNQLQYDELERLGIALTLFQENSDGGLDPQPKSSLSANQLFDPYETARTNDGGAGLSGCAAFRY